MDIFLISLYKDKAYSIPVLNLKAYVSTVLTYFMAFCATYEYK